jgi:uncharacterized protein
MQSSLFNVRVPLPQDGAVFLFNTFSDAQAIVPNELVALLDRLDALSDAGEGLAWLSAEERDALEELSDNGFVVTSRVEERRAVEAHFREVRQSTDTLRVTVLTTLQCNFACNYCYQGDHGDWNLVADKMTLETAARVAVWLEARIDEVRPKKLALMFFGGEPLLNLPVMYYLAERAHTLGRERGVPLSITMVTNGLLLSRDIVERLVPLGLAGIKVTLDGDRETHNRLRPLRGGQGTFDKIVRNIGLVADLCAISIGGNFDMESAESYPELLAFLESQSFAPAIAKVAFKPIIRTPEAPREQRRGGLRGGISLTAVDASGTPLNGTCMTVAGAAVSSGCDACNLLDEKMAWLREETKRRGFPTVDGIHMGPCEIHRDHSYTVGPDGALYACPGFTGEKGQAVGHIDGRQDARLSEARSAFERLAAWKECHDCAFIPVCAGGCTVAAHAEFGDINKPNCHKTSFEQGVAALAHEVAATVRVPALAG